MTASTADSKKPRWEVIVDLVKALAWPLFAFFVVIGFWGPLHAAAEQLPGVISKTETITIAQLTLKIDQSLTRLNQDPSPAVKEVLAKLSPTGIKTLMHLLGSTYWEASQADHGRAEFAELIRLGLAKEIPLADLATRRPGMGYGVDITPLGTETRTFLEDLITAFVGELSTPAK